MWFHENVQNLEKLQFRQHLLYVHLLSDMISRNMVTAVHVIIAFLFVAAAEVPSSPPFFDDYVCIM